MTGSRVCAVVLNWNGHADTIPCLASLRRVEYAPLDVVVVDNGSTDRSVAKIRERFPDVQIIETGANLGFSGGNNVGIQHALERGADYVLLLNNDTVVPPGFLDPLVTFMEERSVAGSVQPVLMRLGQGNTLDSLGQEIGPFVSRDIAFGQPSELVPDAPREIFGPCQAAALFRREVFQRVGLLNHRFFMVFEDLDYSWRMREVGIQSWLVPASTVFHKRGASGPGQSTNERVRYHVGKNAFYIRLRYHPIGLAGLLPIVATFLLLTASSTKRRSLLVFWSFSLDALRHRMRHQTCDRQIFDTWALR